MQAMHATQDTLNLTPPQPPGMLRALGLALVAHALLLAALTWGVHWKQTESPAVEAEIWSSAIQQAAPRAVEPPITQPEPPQPKPEPVPPPPPKPVPKVDTPPPPAPVVRDADIALEREKKKRELEKQRQEEQRLDALEEKKEQLKKAAVEKKKLEQKQKEQDARREALAEAETKRKAAADAAEAKRKVDTAQAQKAQQQAQQQAQAQQKEADAQRKKNLERMQGMAGASGAANATGTALQSSGPSGSYGGRVSAKVKPNIVFPDDIAGNPTADVEVRSSPDGTIISRRLIKSSGVKAWDDAVLKAIDKTETMPRDVDGRVPSPLTIGFRPKD